MNTGPQRPLSILRALGFYRWSSLAVVAGAAIATAVLAGALVVGDSVRGSLRDLSRERLGGIDQALVAQRFVRQELIDQVADDPALAGRIDASAPAIVLRGSIEHAARHSRASQVGVQGIDARFLSLFGRGAPTADALFPPDAQRMFPPVAINQRLQRALGAALGDQVLLHLKRWSEVPRGSLLGRKDTSEVVESLRLEISAVIADRGLGRFSLQAGQSQPLLAFIPRSDLARALGQSGSVNALLLGQQRREEDLGETLDAVLAEQLEPADIGLSVRAEGDVGVVESDELVLRPAIEAATLASAEAAGLQPAPVLAYLANRIAKVSESGPQAGSGGIPYATVVALDPVTQGAPGLRRADGSPLVALGRDEILLNAWAAEDLGAAAGDRVELRYFTVGAREALVETSTELTVRGVVAMRGLGADSSLVQEVPGMADSENMADWDPPFPVDLSRIRPADEAYWDRWHDTPKAFVSLATGRSLWRTRWGASTSIRLLGLDPHTRDTVLPALATHIVRAVPREALGLRFRPVLAEGLAASAGATDFSGLFLGFSIFLIVSAAMLAALLFRLGIERRAPELGLYLALGFGRKQVRRRLLAEGTLLATFGALAGIAGAVVYGGGMMLLLRTWWLPAVGTTALTLHAVPQTLVIGAVASILVVALSILRSVGRMSRLPPTALLGRILRAPSAARSTSRTRWFAAGTLLPALALLVLAVATGRSGEPGWFFAIGPLLLAGGLAGLALVAERERGAARAGRSALLTLGAANARRNRGRSLLAAGLVAVATFMIVTVAAFERDEQRAPLERASGTGGFALVAESEVPLLLDPASEDGRFALGMPETAADPLEQATIVPLRRLPGDDTSCLNLYRPQMPQILAVPPEVIERQAFRFVRTLEPVPEGASPWSLLERSFPDGAIPVIGDDASMQYILKLPLGGDLERTDQRGARIKLRLVATLGTSIFQRELLMAEAPFLDHFPDQEGFSSFLIDAPEAAIPAVSEALEAGLAPYGLDAVTTRDRLATFSAVQNTYLSTFRTLGGLGLLLGTLGLAVVLLRNVVERRGELAAMRAFGFSRRWLTKLVVVENALLLVAGLGLGALAALVTVLPQLLAAGAHVPLAALSWTLGIILILGLLTCWTMAAGALRAPLIEALKVER